MMVDATQHTAADTDTCMCNVAREPEAIIDMSRKTFRIFYYFLRYYLYSYICEKIRKSYNFL